MTDNKEFKRIKKGWGVEFGKIKEEEKINYKLSLPEVNEELTITSDNYSHTEQTLFGNTKYAVWSGKIHGSGKGGSFLFLKGDDGGYGGIFHYDGQTFEVLPISKRHGLIREVDHAWSDGHICGAETQPEGGKVRTETTTSNLALVSVCNTPPSSTCLKPWKVVNAYPQDVINYIYTENNGNNFLASLAIAMIKATFTKTLENSGISAPKLNIVDVNIGTFNNFTGNMLTDISSTAIINKESELKVTHKQDRTIFITIQNYGFISGNVNCIPYTASGGYNNSCTRGLVRWQTFWAPEWTYAHELGHLFGARHDPINDDEPICGKGKIFKFPYGGEDRTMMATRYTFGVGTNAVTSSTGILYFSEPGKFYTYNGISYEIGSPTQNNKRLVNNFLCGNYNFTGEDNGTAFRLSSSDFVSSDNSMVYPNPVKDYLRIEFNEQASSIELISTSGVELRNFKLESQQYSYEINTSELTRGTYYLRIISPTSSKIIKFIKP